MGAAICAPRVVGSPHDHASSDRVEIWLFYGMARRSAIVRTFHERAR